MNATNTLNAERQTNNMSRPIVETIDLHSARIKQDILSII